MAASCCRWCAARSPSARSWASRLPVEMLRGLSAALALLFALGGVTACGRQADNAVLRVANQKGSTRAMMVAAGVLNGAPYRVEWSEFPAAQPLLEAVGGGATDLGLAGDAPFIFAY